MQQIQILLKKMIDFPPHPNYSYAFLHSFLRCLLSSSPTAISSASERHLLRLLRFLLSLSLLRSAVSSSSCSSSSKYLSKA